MTTPAEAKARLTLLLVAVFSVGLLLGLAGGVLWDGWFLP